MHITGRCVNALKIDTIKMYLGFPITIVSSNDYGRNVCEKKSGKKCLLDKPLQRASRNIKMCKHMRGLEGAMLVYVCLSLLDQVLMGENKPLHQT